VAVLSDRALNRALLARQWLLARQPGGVLGAVRHLVGLQAQEPHDPYVALRARLRQFDPHELGRLLTDREVLRMGLMRATIHLVTADDALVLRPLVQDVLERNMRSVARFRAVADAVDMDAVGTATRARMEASPATGPQLRTFLAERFPDADAAALADVIRLVLPLVQITPRAVWGRTLRPTWTTLESWLGRSPGVPDPAAVIRRYLAAFGPASAADFATWSRLTRVRELFEPLADELVRFTDERGRTLYDVPGAPLPDPDTPAPVRFLPQYDNVFLSHDDRSRIAPSGFWDRVLAVDSRPHFVLVDGMVAGIWRLAVPGRPGPPPQPGDSARLVVTPFRTLPAAARDELQAEGVALLGLLAPAATAVEVELADPML